MISDIQSMLNASSGKQSNASNRSLLLNTGTIAKLSSEIKLIENLSLIKFQGSESLNFQGKPAQLLHATSAQQPFTLINTGTPINISDLQNAQLHKSHPMQASLTLPVDNQTNKTGLNQPLPSIKQADNLMLASRVVNLTVTSVAPAANSTNTAQPIGNTSQPTPNTSLTPAAQTPLTTTSNTTLSPTAIATSNTSQPTSNTPQNPTATATNTSLPTSNTPQNPTATATGNTPLTPTPTPTATQAATNTLLTSAPLTAGNTNQALTTAATNATRLILATVSDGQSEFPIISQTALKKGDIVRVMVDANNNMQVLPAKTKTPPPSLQIEALKHSLPRQLSLGDMSQLVKQLHRLNETSSANLPPQTQQALKQLMQHLPALGTLTTSPETMKQAIQTSGLFSESLLAKDSQTQIPADLKLNLIRLKDSQENTGPLRLNSFPTEQIASAIERITTSQLRHFADPNQINTPTYPLHIELPIRNSQTTSFVQIEIDKDASTEEHEKQDRRWLVKLKFDFEETGRFDARAGIQANKVGIIFAAEDPDTVQKLKRSLPDLKQQLTSKDIKVERLDAFQATLEKEKANVTNTQSLIDVRT